MIQRRDRGGWETEQKEKAYVAAVLDVLALGLQTY